jgi:hypothetical protein
MVYLGDLLARLAPEAVVVVIVRIIFKLLTHAIDDEERWRRLMSVLAPVLAVVLTLAVVAAWWLLADDGLQVVLHAFGQVPALPRRNLEHDDAFPRSSREGIKVSCARSSMCPAAALYSRRTDTNRDPAVIHPPCQTAAHRPCAEFWSGTGLAT